MLRLCATRGCGLIIPSYGDGRPSRRFGCQNRDCPDLQRMPSRTGREIGPWQRKSEIARQCATAVGQERPLGTPGGLFLLLELGGRRLHVWQCRHAALTGLDQTAGSAGAMRTVTRRPERSVPAMFSSAIRPLKLSTMRFTMDRPRPDPSPTVCGNGDRTAHVEHRRADVSRRNRRQGN